MSDKCDKWDFSNPPLTGQCQPADAQAALDAVRQNLGRNPHTLLVKSFDEAVLAALENLDARLKALEGK